MKRREFLTLTLLAATLPLTTRAQQARMRRIGLLNGFAPDDRPYLLAAFRLALGEAGYVEGRNLTIEYRWARGQLDQLPSLTADLIQSKVEMIVTCGGDPPALAVKVATRTIPIVSTLGRDPIKSGFIASFNRPGGNITGVAINGADLEPKRLEVLHELIPAAKKIGYLVDTSIPFDPTSMLTAAKALALQVRLINVPSLADLDAAFSTFGDDPPQALIVALHPIFDIIPVRNRTIALAAQHAIPVAFSSREQVEAGGLVSYGSSIPAVYRLLGQQAAQVLDGRAPGELPFLQPTKFDLLVNLKTANALRITIPQSILVRADEVIERE